jgi:4-amino-4-deoxy-L-arabinose transferase-like glycosyltransferase
MSWLLIAALAFAVRTAVALFAGPAQAPLWEQSSFAQITSNLARGIGFALGGPPYNPTASLAPLSPWLTSLIYHAAGHHSMAGVLFHCMLGALIPLLAGAFAGALFGGGVGRLAAWLCVFLPVLVLGSSLFPVETTFCLMLLIALNATIAWVKTPRPARAFGVGLAWGLAALAHATALWLLPVVAFWAWRPVGLTLARRDAIRQLAFVLVALTLIVGPWTLRNAVVLHGFAPISTGYGLALLKGNKSQYETENHGFGHAKTVFEADALAAKEAKRFVWAHRSEWVVMAGTKIMGLWRAGISNDPEMGRTRVRLGWLNLILAASGWIAPFVLWGAARALSGPRSWFQSLPVLIVLYFVARAVLLWGGFDTRFPMEPFNAVLAAVAFEDVRKRIRSRRRGFRVIEGRRVTSR